MTRNPRGPLYQPAPPKIPASAARDKGDGGGKRKRRDAARWILGRISSCVSTSSRRRRWRACVTHVAVCVESDDRLNAVGHGPDRARVLQSRPATQPIHAMPRSLRSSQNSMFGILLGMGGLMGPEPCCMVPWWAM